MKNYVKILAVSSVALSLGACNVATVAPMAGAGLGGLGGGALGSQIGSGKGKLIATGVGALLGAFGGYKTGQHVALPYQNQNAINTNVMNIHRNNQRINQNTNGIKMNGQRINDMHSSGRRYNYDGTPIIVNQDSSRGSMSNYGCSVRNNYVVCNSH
jgi:uncharacterized protein YcfJ